jgi:HD-like signal output (HDOD) protein
MQKELQTPEVVEEALTHISRIATLPAIAGKILSLVDDENVTAGDLEKLISGDPVLSARVLKVVNSTFYGMPSTIGSIRHAVVVLGFDALRNIALAASMSRFFKGSLGQIGFNIEDIWLHSAAVAVAARMIGAQTDVDPSECFLVGIVHDIGMVVQMQARTDEFAMLVEAFRAGEIGSYRRAELQFLGAPHDEYGLGLCRKWNFPRIIHAAVGYHHEPAELTGHERRIAQIVSVADSLAAEAKIGFCCAVSHTISPQAMAELNLTDQGLNEIREALPGAASEAASLYS